MRELGIKGRDFLREENILKSRWIVEFRFEVIVMLVGGVC